MELFLYLGQMRLVCKAAYIQIRHISSIRHLTTQEFIHLKMTSMSLKMEVLLEEWSLFGDLSSEVHCPVQKYSSAVS